MKRFKTTVVIAIEGVYDDEYISKTEAAENATARMLAEANSNAEYDGKEDGVSIDTVKTCPDDGRLNTTQCPHCLAKLDFDTTAESDVKTISHGRQFHYQRGTCPKCGKVSYLTAQYLGVLTEEEFKNL